MEDGRRFLKCVRLSGNRLVELEREREGLLAHCSSHLECSSNDYLLNTQVDACVSPFTALSLIHRGEKKIAALTTFKTSGRCSNASICHWDRSDVCTRSGKQNSNDHQRE
jgi:hypothetical protein